MTDLRTAAQQTLEALRCVDLQSLVPDYGSGHYSVARLDGPQVKSAITAMEAALAEPTLQTCNCRWDGEVQVQQCTLHEAHIDAIHEWAERAKKAEKKLAALAEPEPPIGKASTDVGVPVYALKKAEPPCNKSCAPGYCYCEPVEPVAWMVYTEDGKSVCVTDHPADFIEWRSLPLYTSPPQRKPLSDEEIAKCWHNTPWNADLKTRVFAFARAVEAAHGIKEGT